MTTYHVYIRCTRCEARTHLITYTPAMLEQDPRPPLPLEKARAWLLQHQGERHAVDDPTRPEIERWLLGYRADLPARPYDVICTEEETAG